MGWDGRLAGNWNCGEAIMVKAILGKKLGMTQIFGENGDVVPVTLLKAGPCVVIQRKTATKDGYEAAQLGLVEVRLRRAGDQGDAKGILSARRQTPHVFSAKFGWRKAPGK